MSRHSPTKYWTGDLIWCNPELPQNIVIILTVIRFRKNVARGLSQFGDPTTIQMKKITYAALTAVLSASPHTHTQAAHGHPIWELEKTIS